MIITSTIMEIILSPRKEKGTINGSSIIQRSADKHTRRSSVTTVSYCRECLMAMYLSTWTMAKWESVKLPSTLKASLDNTVFIQYVLEVFPCSCAITQAIKAGWPITYPHCQISSRQAGECNVWLGFQSVFSLNSDYDQCIHNSCDWTSNDVDDGNEDKPTISTPPPESLDHMQELSSSSLRLHLNSYCLFGLPWWRYVCSYGTSIDQLTLLSYFLLDRLLVWYGFCEVWIWISIYIFLTVSEFVVALQVSNTWKWLFMLIKGLVFPF